MYMILGLGINHKLGVSSLEKSHSPALNFLICSAV